MKVSDVVEAMKMLDGIAKKEMYGAGALEFANFAYELIMISKEFETKRLELIKKYGEVIEEDGTKRFQVLPDNEKKFKTAVKKLLNKNQLYVNLSEIDDEDFKVSEDDKKLNQSFYGEAYNG